MGARCDVDDPRRRALPQTFQKQVRQQKIGQMVEGPGHLDAVHRLLELPEQRTGIVEQNVQRLFASQELSGEPPHFDLGRQIRQQVVDPGVAGFPNDVRHRRFAPAAVAAHQYHLGAGRSQPSGRLQSHATGASGYQCNFAL